MIESKRDLWHHPKRNLFQRTSKLLQSDEKHYKDKHSLLWKNTHRRVVHNDTKNIRHKSKRGQFWFVGVNISFSVANILLLFHYWVSNALRRQNVYPAGSEAHKITLYSLELIVLKVDTLLCYTLIFTLQRFIFISIFHVSPRMEATILNQRLIYDSTTHVSKICLLSKMSSVCGVNSSAVS